jgi:phage repressor protein C with HTH and peptisase S24 domain
MRTKAIAAKARQAMKGTAFEQKKKEDRKWPKATVEEIPDEEKPVKTLPNAEPIGPQDRLMTEEPNSPTIAVTSSNEKNEPESLPEEPQGELESDEDLLFAYIKVEPVIGILQMATAPLTTEFDEPRFSYSRKTRTISRLTKSLTSSRYCIRAVTLIPEVGIRAKTSVSQQLAHESEKDQEAHKKTLN